MIGGYLANRTDWPFLAVISYGPIAHCSGTLINPKWVLTAAHCVTPDTMAKFLLLNMTLGIGLDILEQRMKLNTEIVQNQFLEHVNKQMLLFTIDHWLPVEKAILHEGFFEKENSNLDIGQNDIALLKMFLPVKLSDRIQTIPLNTYPPAGGTPCKTAGWGDKIIDLSSHLKIIELKSNNFLTEINISIMDEKKLDKAVEEMMLYKELYYLFPALLQKDKRMMLAKKIGCASENFKSAVTKGDSGGPLICEGLLFGVTHTLMAVVQLDCHNTMYNFYSIFTRVDSYRNWIDRTMSEKGHMSRKNYRYEEQDGHLQEPLISQKNVVNNDIPSYRDSNVININEMWRNNFWRRTGSQGETIRSNPPNVASGNINVVSYIFILYCVCITYC